MNLPNILTFSRIAAIPLIVGSFYGTTALWHWMGLGVFLAAGLTDYFDGFIARKWHKTTPLGRFLDPLADKLIIAAVLLMLVGMNRITGLSLVPAVVILCRELTISGLREYLSALNVMVPVIALSQWKTTLQLISLGCLMAGDSLIPHFPGAFIGEVLLWVSALLTLITGIWYLQMNKDHF